MSPAFPETFIVVTQNLSIQSRHLILKLRTNHLPYYNVQKEIGFRTMRYLLKTL